MAETVEYRVKSLRRFFLEEQAAVAEELAGQLNGVIGRRREEQ